MRSNARAVLLILFTVSVFLLSCAASPPRRDAPVKDFGEKVRDDFARNVAKGDFIAACRNYIEYAACCGDREPPEGEARQRALVAELGGLYAKKTKEPGGGDDAFTLLEYTFSFLSIARSAGMEGEFPEAASNLPVYVERYMNSNIAGKDGVEKLSWLIHMTRFLPQDADIYRRIVEAGIEQNNPLLADKYLSMLRGSPRENALESIRLLEERIRALREENARAGSEPAIPIDDTIRSSVKIVVDKGIKTRGGVGMPDQLLGTGVVIDGRGYIITNHHIIESSVDPKYEGYSKVYVIPGRDENERFVAKIVGYDPVFDLALLKIEKKLDSLIRFGDSDALKQGERVVAIGNPVGLTNTVTSGVVSSTDRPFLQIGSIVQIDAALNPGNSGGALIDANGYLVGIAFAGLEQFENLNFAIPSNLVLNLLFKLYGGGRVTRSWIGCALEGGGSGAGDPDRRGSGRGVSINYIASGGPAGAAGIRRGDIIREVNGKPVSSIGEVQDAVSYLPFPLVVNLTLEREKTTLVRSVLIEERPEYPALYVYKRDAYENLITPLFGIVIGGEGGGKRKAYTVQRVVSGSVASGAGVSEGDIIRIRTIKYDEKLKVFAMAIEMKSKRFGYLTRPLTLYTYVETNTFA